MLFLFYFDFIRIISCFFFLNYVFFLSSLLFATRYFHFFPQQTLFFFSLTCIQSSLSFSALLSSVPFFRLFKHLFHLLHFWHSIDTLVPPSKPIESCQVLWMSAAYTKIRGWNTKWYVFNAAMAGNWMCDTKWRMQKKNLKNRDRILIELMAWCSNSRFTQTTIRKTVLNSVNVRKKRIYKQKLQNFVVIKSFSHI